MRYGLHIPLRERTKADLMQMLKTADGRLRKAIMDELALRKARVTR
jgi:hypothetical protein